VKGVRFADEAFHQPPAQLSASSFGSEIWSDEDEDGGSAHLVSSDAIVKSPIHTKRPVDTVKSPQPTKEV
jgi:hypothetical protein